MDKKSIFGIAIAVIALVAFQLHQAKQMQAYRIEKAAYDAQVAAAAEQEAKKTAAGQPAAATPGAPSLGQPVNTPATPAVPEKIEKLQTPAADYAFTNLGGGISRTTLHHHILNKETKAPIVLNEFGTIPIGAVSTAAGEHTNLPFTSTVDAAAGAITFERVDEQQLALTKRFTLPKVDGLKENEKLRDEYLVQLDLTFTNRSAQALNVPPYWVHTGEAAPIHAVDLPQYIGFNYLHDTSNKFTNLTWFAEGGFLMFKRAARQFYPEKQEPMDQIRWAAVANQYFTQMVIPKVDPNGTTEVLRSLRGTGIWARENWISAEQWAKVGRPSMTRPGVHSIDGAIQMNGFKLEPGQNMTRTFQVLMGPSEYSRLKELNDYETELLDFGMFGLISKGLLISLNWLKGLLGSYWAAICLLTICIRSAMWPLQNRATQTAKKMAALSPRLKEIQDRHKEDPVRLQQETAKLWKQYGINPLGGCLPMFVQIPIFFGFYNMLNKAVELRNAGFLWWVQDLSQPDTIGHIAGFPINILPLVMAGTMLVQMRLTPKAGDPAQQKLMMFMPLIFIALCYNYAAALALYWSVQNLFSIVQLYITRDKQGAAVEIIPPPKKARR